jgi:peptidoglycan/xylan/chitin deacetylase (PgdA/CDA1 family)
MLAPPRAACGVTAGRRPSAPAGFIDREHGQMRHIRRPAISAWVAFLLCSAPGFRPSPARSAAPPGRANELGRILVLEYHRIQPEETRWGRSVANFRNDLELLYQSGYRPIGLADYVDGKIAVPHGTRPFLLTFDDSSPGQFRYRVGNGTPEIDPDCAVGMLLRFHELHPDFELRGVFFVLPAADQPNRLFGQPEFEGRKLRELVSLGFEIGNHTLWHADLAKYDASTVQEQIVGAAQAVQRLVPGYRMRALSLPLGNYPRDASLAAGGAFRGTEYRFDAVFMVAGGAAPSPFRLHADFTRLPRIQVTGAELQHWISRFARNPSEGYVSDGRVDAVTAPRELMPEFNAARFGHVRIFPADSESR